MNKFSVLFLLLLFNFFLINKIFAQTNSTIFYDDFENGLGEWTSYNLSNPNLSSLWHLNSVKYVSEANSIGWFDSLNSSYPVNSYEALVSPAVLIPSNAKVYLSFDVFIHLSPHGTNSNDKFDIQISTNNGSSWTFFSRYGYSGQQIGWKNFPNDFTPTETGDLTPYAGKSVKIRYLISTDNQTPDGEGVFIDNFKVTKVDCEFNDPFEPNNTTDLAVPIIQGQGVDAALCPVGDFDFYSFNVNQNDKINISVEHNVYSVTLTLYNAAGVQVASTGNKKLNYNAISGGLYKLKVSLDNIFSYTLTYKLYLNVINTKPDVISVVDVPNDQGLKVQVLWQHSLFDPPDSVSTIKEYHLFRKVIDTSSTSRIIKTEDLLSKELIGSTVIFENEFWDYVATVPAISPRTFTDYSFTAPTLKDSSEATFKIAAVSKTLGQPVLWGTSGTGISFDNIAPEFENYSINYNGNGITLDWSIDNLIYYDVSAIKVYKGMYERFAPLYSSMIAELNSTSTTYTDNQVNPGQSYYYMLAVTDLFGNTTYTNHLNVFITSVDDNKLTPREFALKQNYPNPFNPSTVIEFSIPAAQNISLKIYNVLGAEIVELAKGDYSPGLYKINFNAENLPTGIYFYTLNAGEFSETKKLLLIK